MLPEDAVGKSVEGVVLGGLPRYPITRWDGMRCRIRVIIQFHIAIVIPSLGSVVDGTGTFAPGLCFGVCFW